MGSPTKAVSLHPGTSKPNRSGGSHENDWQRPSCHYFNSQKSRACSKCRAVSPANGRWISFKTRDFGRIPANSRLLPGRAQSRCFGQKRGRRREEKSLQGAQDWQRRLDPTDWGEVRALRGLSATAPSAATRGPFARCRVDLRRQRALPQPRRVDSVRRALPRAANCSA
jgi:hypothetical protein